MGATNCDDALRALLDGNARFARDETARPNLSAARRAELLDGQQPLAVVFGCSDSRVPPELIFDCGLGDLFIVRTAGHVLGRPSLGSIEYGALHCRTPLVVVLGHSRCGAVTAAARGSEADGELPSITDAIRPAVDSVRGLPGDLVDNAAKAHARQTAAELDRRSILLHDRVRAGGIRIVAAFYDLGSGRVDLLD